MIFSELYSAYYNTVAAVLAQAVSHPIGDDEIRAIVEAHAFGESILSIPPALKEERWQLIRSDGTTPIKNVPKMPLTLLQKRWLKAISMDPRIRLFGDFSFDFAGVEPLFTPDDILVFDKYADGDPYEDKAYISNFRLISDAIRKKQPLTVEILNRRGNTLSRTIFPQYLEYSEKDDKFRLIGAGDRLGSTINLGRIISCKPAENTQEPKSLKSNLIRPRSVAFELVDERNALERVLMHFAHFKKQAERIDDSRYRVTVYYDKDDETEVVIRVLSFGPMIKVTAPSHFIGLIRKRLTDQKSCER